MRSSRGHGRHSKPRSKPRVGKDPKANPKVGRAWPSIPKCRFRCLPYVQVRSSGLGGYVTTYAYISDTAGETEVLF